MAKECLRCGKCCQEEVCQIGNMAGYYEAPCPLLSIDEDGKSACMLVRTEIEHGLEPIIATALGIEKGCDGDFLELLK